MAVLEKRIESEVGGPVALGVGAVLLVPGLLPAVGRILRPVVKGVIKTGIAVYDETFTGLREATGDIVAEARSELESERRTSTPARAREGRPQAQAT